MSQADTQVLSDTAARLPATEPWFVLGAGAMGCLWSAAINRHLSASLPNAVTLLLRDQQSLNNYPGYLCIDGEQTEHVSIPALVSGSLPAAIKIRRLLLATKAQDSAAAIADILPWLDEYATIVLLQNGIQFQLALSAQRPSATVFCLSTSFGAWMRKPFHVTPAGSGESWLGSLETDVDVRALIHELPASQMNIRIDSNMAVRLWEKLAVNCAINGLTVRHDCLNGELLEIPEARQQCQDLCSEIASLMSALPEVPALWGLKPGITESEDSESANSELWKKVQQVAKTTASNISSTLQDIRRGRATEIQHLNGYLCSLADQHRLPCPLNRQILHEVLQRELPA